MKNMDGLGAEAAGGSEQEQIDETQGELTIYSSDNIYIDWLVQAFNRKYPNIKVVYNLGSNDDSNSFPDYTAKASVDMMSGSAGDVISIGAMPFRQFGRNHLLEDLYPYMENDPEFYQEDYYGNIFEAMEYNDRLWAVPLSFFNYVIRFNKTMLEEHHIAAPEGKLLNYKDIINIYHKIAPNRDKLLIAENISYQRLEFIEYSRYFDEKQGRAYFDSPEFIEFLNEMRKLRWPSKQELRLANLRFFGEDCWDSPGENDLCLILVSSYYKERNAKLFNEHPSNLTVPVPLSASNGDGHFYSPDKMLGISSASKNKELAWKFIRFCIEEKPLETLRDDNIWPLTGTPINRNNTLKLLEDAFGEGNDEGVWIVDGWNSKINEESFFASAYLLYEPIEKITEEFYAGRITAEDCAKQIQERAEIYLKE